jgi:hypothetical protein
LSLRGFLFDDTVFSAMTSLQKFVASRRLSPRSELRGADMLWALRGEPDWAGGANGVAPVTGFGKPDLLASLAVKLEGRSDARSRPSRLYPAWLKPARCHGCELPARPVQITPKCLAGCFRAIPEH